MSERSSYYSSVFSESLNRNAILFLFVWLLGPYWTITAITQQRVVDSRPSLILPLEVNWTVNLGQTTGQTPAYSASAVFISLPSGALTAVSLSDGAYLWDVSQPTDHPPVTDESLIVLARANELLGP